MIETLKVVEKVKFLSKGSLGARHLTKKFAWVTVIIDDSKTDVDHI